MPRQKDETDETPDNAVAAALSAQNELLARQVSIAERQAAIAERQEANAPPNEIGYGHPRYQQRLKDERIFVEFVTPVYQNNKLADARLCSDETIQRLAFLKPGKYLAGKVEVARDTHDRVWLYYQHAQIEDRMRMRTWTSSLNDMVAQMWAEQQAPAVTH